MKRIAVTAFILGCSHAPTPAAPTPPPAVATVDAPKSDPQSFEFKVRADFFDGMRGDAAALQRAIKTCDDALAVNPKHAEALVWHGAAMVGKSSLAYRAGDQATGRTLWEQGLDEMDRAVALAPDNIGVRIPRGAVLLATAPYLPEPYRAPIVKRGIDDYEVTLAQQKPYFTKLTLHAREQLLYALTDGYAMLGDTHKATAYFDEMTHDAAGSELLARAKARAAGDKVDGPTPCEQCHARR
jgi:hypothetical protein